MVTQTCLHAATAARLARGCLSGPWPVVGTEPGPRSLHVTSPVTHPWVGTSSLDSLPPTHSDDSRLLRPGRRHPVQSRSFSRFPAQEGSARERSRQSEAAARPCSTASRRERQHDGLAAESATAANTHSGAASTQLLLAQTTTGMAGNASRQLTSTSSVHATSGLWIASTRDCDQTWVNSAMC